MTAESAALLILSGADVDRIVEHVEALLPSAQEPRPRVRTAAEPSASSYDLV